MWGKVSGSVYCREFISVFFPMKGVWGGWGSLVVLALQRSFLCNSLYEL